MTERLRKFTLSHPRFRKIVGVFCLVLGIIALVTPLTPGALLLLFLGLEFLGLRFLFLENLKEKVIRKKTKTP